MTLVTRVLRNIDSYERELSRHGYDAIHLQYHDIRYDAMYHASTTKGWQCLIVETVLNVSVRSPLKISLYQASTHAIHHNGYVDSV